MSAVASPRHQLPAGRVPRGRSIAGRTRGVVLLGVIAVLLLVPAADAHTLTQRKAIRAIQKKADAYAGNPTKLRYLIRFSRHKFSGGVEWQKREQVVCKCGFDILTQQPVDATATKTTPCQVGVSVRFRSRRSRQLVYRFKDLFCDEERAVFRLANGEEVAPE